ncbi:abc transporter c family member 9, partial [Quercus suber]
WPKLDLPCLWEHASIVVQLGFYAIFLVYLARTKFLDRGIDKYSIRIKFSIGYIASIICSSLLLGTHFLMLMMLLKGSGTQYNSKLELFPQKLCKCYHGQLQLLLFLLSIICIALDSHFGVINHAKLGVCDYADYLGLLASTCLLAFSIQGKTDIIFRVPSGIAEPLLNGKTDEHLEYKRIPTLVQLITFTWLNPLFAVGFKKPLEQEEIPDVDIKDSARFLSHSFDESLKQAIFLFIRKKVAINALFAVISSVASCVGPYLINDFVHFLTEKSTKSLETGCLLVLAFLVANVVETIAQRQWIFGARQLGLCLKAALISRIYKKGLLLSSPSHQNHTIGEIINYMSVDIQRIIDFIWYLNIIWMFPVQISLAIYILHTNLGLGSFAALATTLIVMACNRMKATSKVLQNMKTIKVQAWDSEFLQRLESLRPIELSALSSFIFWGSPAFISVVTFGACMLMGVELTAGRVLSALAPF